MIVAGLRELYILNEKENPFVSSNSLETNPIPTILGQLQSFFQMSIPDRNLGPEGPQVPAVGLGLMSIGGIYGSAGTLDEKLAFLNQAHAVGQYFWDTADVYQDSEDIVGEWFKRSGKRDDIFLATKFGVQRDSKTGSMSIRSDPEYVKIACEKSLKRLGVSTIDLYYCHRVDGVTPIEKTIEAMAELKKYTSTAPLESS